MNAKPYSAPLFETGFIQSIATVVFLVVFLRAPDSRATNPKPAVNTVMKIAAALTAAKTAEGAGEAAQDYFKSTAGPGQSIYSVSFKFERASWSDWLSRPDVFLVVEREGGEPLLIPDIEYGWDCSTKIYTFKCPTLQPGSKCVLRLYDDDSTTDQAWKSILASTTTWDASAIVKPGRAIRTTGLVALEAKAMVGGQLQLFTDAQAQALTIDEPDAMATAEFIVPVASSFSPWEMDGNFMRGSTHYGKVHLTHWYTNPLPTITSYLLRPKVLFWGVLLMGILLVLASRSTRRRSSSAPAPMKFPK